MTLRAVVGTLTAEALWWALNARSIAAQGIEPFVVAELALLHASTTRIHIVALSALLAHSQAGANLANGGALIACVGGCGKEAAGALRVAIGKVQFIR